MKKFLSSLLALTMILSLVVVPAQAADTEITVPESVSVTKGSTQTVTATAPTSTSFSELQGKGSYTAGTSTWRWSESSSHFDIKSGGDAATVTIEGKSKTTSAENLTCTYEVVYTKAQGNDTAGAPDTITVTRRDTVKVTVNDPQGDANAAFAAAIKSAGIKYNDRPCTINSANTTITYYTIKNESEQKWETSPNGYATPTYDTSVSNKLTIKSSITVDGTTTNVSYTYDLSSSQASLTLKSSITGETAANEQVLSNGKLTLTANYTGSPSATYQWKLDSGSYENGGSTYEFSKTSGSYTLYCQVLENDKVADTTSCTITVKSANNFTLKTNPSSLTMSDKSKNEPLSATLSEDGNAASLQNVKYSFVSENTRVATVSQETVGSYLATVKLAGNGETYIKVTAEYLGGKIEKRVPFYGEVHEVTLDEVENGKSDTYSYNTLLSAADKTFKGVSIKSIKVNPTKTTYGEIKDSRYADEYVFEAASGKIGVFTFTVTAYEGSNQNGASYTVTFNIPVTPIKTTYESQYPQPSGTSSNYKYSVAVPDDYESYYVVAKNPDKAPTDYSEKLSGTSSSYSGKSLYTLSGSDFDKSGKCELYIVTYDRKTAYYGVLTVYQKSYNIEYRVVAGESVTFDQKRFESFMEDYADDNIKTSKGDYFEFDYVKFTSLPNSTREGVLYEGKDKIKTSTEVENLDKVTFESVTKAKDTIKVPFTLYAKQYDKNDKVIDKKVSMTGEVVISVVKEDIVFEVGVNSAVKLGSDKFIDFLRDSDKSYKKADLDYVTFDVGKNSAITSYFNGTGALYRYYNGSTGINSTVSAKDEFYYNPKTSSKHYDLDDVTYVTSKFAKVGDIVYIPFTAYGTKSGQKAEGTLAIKVKQTMSFVDVRPGDYFYDSVQWAVNLDITKGTSATTFSPKQGCTRAQIVTFLWRAAGSPAPRSSTNKFTDVYATTHADYMKAIIWATEQGITTGTGNGKFSPDATCTRAQIVTFLYRFKNNPAVYGSLNFSDVNKTEHAAFYNAILWAVNNKITTGYGNGIFDPNGTCNRGDAVTFLYRALA